MGLVPHGLVLRIGPPPQKDSPFVRACSSLPPGTICNPVDSPRIESRLRAHLPVVVENPTAPAELIARYARRRETVTVITSDRDVDHGALIAAGAHRVMDASTVTAFGPVGVSAQHLTGPFTIIGDIHGQLDALLRVLATGGHTPSGSHPDGRLALLVGDLVNKGPDSVGVLRWAVQAYRRGLLLAVAGNHDVNLRMALAKVCANDPTPDQVRERLLAARDTSTRSTAATLELLAADDAVCEGEIHEFAAFLTSLPFHLVLDRGRLVVVHAAIRPEWVGRSSFDSVDERHRAETWQTHGPRRHEIVEAASPTAPGGEDRWVGYWEGPQTVIRGHHPYRAVRLDGRVASIDTGAGEGWSLTAVRWPERQIVTAEIGVPTRTSATAA